MENFKYDQVLSDLYKRGSGIDPFSYFAEYFDQMRNKIDLWALKFEINPQEHERLIQVIKDHENESMGHLRENSTFFQEDIDKIIGKTIQLNKKTPATQEFVELFIEIKREWIEARKKVFKKNLFFMSSKYRTLTINIEPFCLDKDQTDIIEYKFYNLNLSCISKIDVSKINFEIKKLKFSNLILIGVTFAVIAFM